jgi:2-polyprenyl-6-methoxyphenol hydroxylase-like FAD-dependent oxidoreductase
MEDGRLRGGRAGRVEETREVLHGCDFSRVRGSSRAWDVRSEGVYDVCIAGGGPAGVACAIASALQGLRVVVVDGMRPPIDKACGEGLMPDTLAALAELGVRFAAGDGFPIRGIRFLDGGKRTEGRFPAGSGDAAEMGDGLGMRRVVLHERLLERAAALGVEFRWETAIQGVEQDWEQGAALLTNRGAVRARFVVGADGHQSRVRAAAGLEGARLSARRIGLRQHFARAPWTDFVEVYWSNHGQAYVTPVAANEVCVAFVARSRFASVFNALACFPELAGRLEEVAASSSPRGAITLSRKLDRVTRGRVALVGDASGSVDAVTGEGLSLCFRQALALADALKANDLDRYQRAHTRMRRMPHLMASTLLALDRSPGLRRTAIGALALFPGVFEGALAVHVGGLV